MKITDKMRVDWLGKKLEELGHVIFVLDEEAANIFPEYLFCRKRIILGENKFHKTIREKFDSAIRSEKK